MSQSEKQLNLQNFLNELERMDEESVKSYLSKVYFIFEKSKKNGSNELSNELENLFNDIVHLSQKESTPTSSSGRFKRLNIPLAKVGLSNKQKKLKEENAGLLKWYGEHKK
ncbi:hypothetical protein [Alkalibacillus haloalkaliphilus]|uniref:hypothetical protein n=1 Tax=Alkalibacillus haloalkaliphilus TaxID=94136 RepID=UPI00293589C5|nr:hypothetical protein [Alkalibacillus haloalkaliphilus]MDV2581661.1 hypothetical protein [Alkalibacillus haloalkaliphilus]